MLPRRISPTCAEADAVVIWLADAAGQALLSMLDGTRAALNDTDAGDAWRYQRIVDSDSIWVPVTVRGDALGVLDHTDAYEVARRSEPFELSMEIQRRLLPQAFVCEGGSFALAGWLEPSATAGGDSFDHIASHDRLTLKMIDAVGHEVQAALLATLAVNACRNVRRNGARLDEQARAPTRP
jgi:hypothetical protein